MTAIAASPVMGDQLDLLDAIADTETPLGKLHADDFRAACIEAAAFNDNWVNPNEVSAILHRRFGEVNPRWLSAMWAPACGPRGFLDKTDVEVPIDGKHSRGNANKSVKLRRLRSPRAGDTTRRGTESDALGRVSEPRRERVEPLPAPRSGAVGEDA